MTDEEIARRLANCELAEETVRFAPGRKFGEWEISAFIARGGTAEVYCAKHTLLGTKAAIKIPLEPLTESRKGRFSREAKLLSELDTPAFPRFFAFGEEGAFPYLVEELLEPGELPSSDQSTARYLLALCKGLNALHRRGIVHRDLKPNNILFRDTGEPVIVDLGLARSSDVLPDWDGYSIVDGKPVGVGTPEYSAPEQFSGGPITPAADIHALGVLAEKLICGRRKRVNVLAWRQIIRKATSSIPSERYQSVDEIAKDIRRRHWLRNTILACVGVVCLTFVVFAVGSIVKATRPQEFNLNGQTLVRESVKVRRGCVCRVIGPGTLDAEIIGDEGAMLWMTNCVVLNRVKNALEQDKLKYELAGDVYLNFINLHEPFKGLRERILPFDGASNELRFHGPDTISGLFELKNFEYFQELKQDM